VNKGKKAKGRGVMVPRPLLLLYLSSYSIYPKFRHLAVAVRVTGLPIVAPAPSL
jgi:hypothetical protein